MARNAIWHFGWPSISFGHPSICSSLEWIAMPYLDMRLSARKTFRKPSPSFHTRSPMPFSDPAIKSVPYRFSVAQIGSSVSQSTDIHRGVETWVLAASSAKLQLRTTIQKASCPERSEYISEVGRLQNSGPDNDKRKRCGDLKADLFLQVSFTPRV